MKIGIRFAIATVSIILVVSIAANGYFYFSVNDFQKQVLDDQTQIEALNRQILDLQNQSSFYRNLTSVLQSEKTNLNNQIASLNSQIANLTSSPNLVTSLGIKDIHLPPNLFPSNTNYRLFIQGTVNNTGARPAYNSSLHVTLYQNNKVIVDTHVDLGTIYGDTSVWVETNIPYTGDPLSKWAVTPEYKLHP
jgi:hypothetical protein